MIRDKQKNKNIFAKSIDTNIKVCYNVGVKQIQASKTTRDKQRNNGGEGEPYGRKNKAVQNMAPNAS
jgi:hypothetical protein